MSNKFLLGLLMTTVAPTGLMAQGQLAAGPNGSAGQTKALPAPLADQDAAGVAEIVVTAQKRAERIQDVPIAITVVGADALNGSGAKNLTELQGVVPGIFVSGNSGYGSSPIAIRGTAGTNSFLLDDPVAIYVNGVYQASGTFGGTSFLDVGSIEIVRGPQGTLQGRNATAGAILVRSAEPTATFKGFARFSIADPLEVRGEAALGGPLTDTLGIRVAANFFHERGWADNLFDGEPIGGGHGYAARMSLLWQPVSDLDLRLVAGRTLTQSEPALTRWAATPFNPSPAGPLVPSGTATPTTPLPAGQIDAVLKDDDFALNRPTFNRIVDNSLALNATYTIGGADIVSVTGYDKIQSRGAADSDGLARTDREGFNSGSLPTENFSQELRLQSNGKRRFSWILGAYFSNSQQDMDFHINNLQLSVPDRRTTRFLAFQTTKSYAAFADATFHFTPQLAAIGGIRYTRETKRFQFDRILTNFDTGAPLAPLFEYRPAQANFTNTSFRAKLTYEPTSDLLFYASYSTGFKGGGFNAFGTDPAFNPEKLRSAEAGIKADFLDRRASLSLAAYTNRYDDLQVRVGVPTGGIAITNAADSKIDGLELEATLRPIPMLTLSGNISYTDARFSNFQSARNLLDQGPFDASGNRLPRTPKWQYFVQASFTPELSDTVSGLLEGTVRYRSRIYLYHTDQNAFPVQGVRLTEVGLRVGVKFIPQDLSITAFATNISNGRSANGANINFSYPEVSFNKPRSIGLQIEKRF